MREVEEFESDQWENEGEGGGVRVRKEVDRKRDEKKHTRRNNNLKKKSFMILEILITFIFSRENSASFAIK